MTSPPPPPESWARGPRMRVVEGVLVALLIAIGTGRILAAHRVLSNTFDEGVNVTCGLEWWKRGTTIVDTPNGPFSRIFIGFLPYMRGIEFQEGVEAWEQGSRIFLSENNYVSTLSAARAGVLPFFWAASLGTWFWSRRLFGVWPALGALLLFTNLPPVLAHSGFATTDMAITATFVWFVWAGTYWLEAPSARRASLLAVCFAMALASKFSVLPFGLAAGVAVLALWWWLRPAGEPVAAGWRVWLGSAGVFVVVSYLAVWALYRFSLWSVADYCLAKGYLDLEDRPWLRTALSLAVPGTLFQGVAAVTSHVRTGHESFLMGEVFTHGRLIFYPLDLALKTPLGFLFLSLLGVGVTARTAIQRRDWRLIAPGAAAVAVFLSILTSSLNLGIRYLLPVYPLLAVASAGGLAALWSPSLWRRALVIVPIAWVVIASAASHPDYIAYFNELAGSKPEHYFVESDLDWGQDALRLQDKLEELGVERFSIAYFGHFDFDGAGFPPHEELIPGQPVTGWVAVSLTTRSLDPEGFAWLNDYEPVGRVGKSIDLYHIDE